MKITYYGTAAAEGQPALFCSCPTCEYARQHGGKDVRTRSQAMINDDLLIDFPADTYHHVLTHGLPLHKIENCIVTHAHSDHLYPADLATRGCGYAHGCNNPLHLYGTAAVGEKLREATVSVTKQERFCFHEIRPYEKRKIGRYTVIPLPARHAPETGPVIYVIGDGDVFMLYGNDTGLLFDEVYDFLQKEKIVFSFVSLDCCCAFLEPKYPSHMNFAQNLETRDRLLAIGAANDKTVFCSHHFSHNGTHVLYHEFEPLAAKEGFLMSYDGMEYEIG